jgi:hypothetical protein
MKTIYSSLIVVVLALFNPAAHASISLSGTLDYLGMGGSATPPTEQPQVANTEEQDDAAPAPEVSVEPAAPPVQTPATQAEEADDVEEPETPDTEE